VKYEDWGLVEYTEACDRQLRSVEEVAAGGEDRLVFCTHPPVVTKGRSTSSEDLDGWSGSTIESSRGGRATYHGPSQIVIYPILKLKERDIHAYLRLLEETTATALHELGLKGAERRETPKGGLSLTGVWIGERKIASVGIAVRKWITYHGVAINVIDDPQAHRGIRPCGFTPETMTSVEKELGREVNLEETKSVFRRCFEAALSR
jgi:lipoate-protein ligase B